MLQPRSKRHGTNVLVMLVLVTVMLLGLAAGCSGGGGDQAAAPAPVPAPAPAPAPAPTDLDVTWDRQTTFTGISLSGTFDASASRFVNLDYNPGLKGVPTDFPTPIVTPVRLSYRGGMLAEGRGPSNVPLQVTGQAHVNLVVNSLNRWSNQMEVTFTEIRSRPVSASDGRVRLGPYVNGLELIDPTSTSLRADPMQIEGIRFPVVQLDSSLRFSHPYTTVRALIQRVGRGWESSSLELMLSGNAYFEAVAGYWGVAVPPNEGFDYQGVFGADHEFADYIDVGPLSQHPGTLSPASNRRADSPVPKLDSNVTLIGRQGN